MMRQADLAHRDYCVFGLRVQSEIRLPELVPARAPGKPDIVIRCATLPDAYPSAPGVHALEDGALLVVEGIARFHIRDGSEMRVEPADGAAERNVRLYLLGSALGLLIHQRGLLALHANAVEIGGKAFLFMGASGEGKSTLAAWFHDHGYRIIADDVCVVRFDDGERPYATPGLPRLRLWKEVLEASGRQAAQFDRSYAGDDTWEKYDVPLSSDRRVETDTAIAGIYLLRRGDELEIEPVRGLSAADALFANTYRGAYVSTAGDARIHYQACLHLIRRTPIFAVRRSWDLDRMGDEVQAIVNHAARLSAVTGENGPVHE